jgi:hypothetical protein
MTAQLEQATTDLIHYTVDDEPQLTGEQELTARQILTQAQIDPANHYLVQIEGSQQKSYKGKPDVSIPMHQEMKFVSVSRGPTPVS